MNWVIDMKKTVTWMYQILLIAGVLLIILSMLLGKAKVTELESNPSELVVVETQIDEDVSEFYLQLEEWNRGNNCIMFFTSHQYIWVYQDGELIYSVEDGGTVFGNTSAGGWNYVQIDPQTEEVMVRIEAAYPEVRDRDIIFYQGNAIEMYMESMRGSILEVIVSILDLVIGIALIVYYSIARKEMLMGRGRWYFGLFAILMGLWSLNESEMMTILMDNRVSASYLGYMMLMLMIAPFILFVREFLELGRDKISYVICMLSFANVMICTFLHMTGILEFKRTVVCTHLLMLTGLLYLVYALAHRIKKRGFDRMVKTNLLGVILLASAFLVDMGAFYTGAIKTDVFGRFGFLLYIMLLGKETAKSTIAKVKAGRKAEVYRELAVKDILTGVYNRNAYDGWASKNHKPSGTAIITFDLNELKKCNDTLGHTSGDKYIQDATALLVKVYEPTGRCYRIGGDEFCVTIDNADVTWIENSFQELEHLEHAYNQTSELVKMQIAHGYAVFDEKRDEDVEDTRGRADALMYKNKKMRKKQGI